MGRLFGTDGVRGIANKELTAALAYSLGVAGGLVLGKGVKGKRPVVLIGRDTRISGDMLEDSISAGLLSMGCDVIKAGVIPTPGVAFLTKEIGAAAGVVISASHNTFEYNGVKFFNARGRKLEDEVENEIEEIIAGNKDVNGHITGSLVGRTAPRTNDAMKHYTEFLTGSVKTELSGLRIVVDCANGAAYQSAKAVFGKLGVRALYMGVNPDGTNINDGCGSTHPERMMRRVVKEKADAGLAFDGDADRLIAADETGRVVDGDKLMFICAKALKAEGKLKNDLLTATVMSNLGLAEALGKEGIRLQRADVGDRYVLEMMQKTDSILGGEQSGHIIFLSENTTGDGTYAALRFLEALVRSGKKASELSAAVTIYPQVLKNAKVKDENKYSFDKDEKIAAAMASAEEEMRGRGRMLIRPSGTEPLVRVMLEGEDRKKLDHLADRMVRLLEDRLR
ncbi:MAG: phosphoglucosamine mutase [Clostridiales Family XIII bacterium]|jgi:phosphoglucosamine mutase|nr:phosphoglucosamine mutase [Clostridiales Family XIII bacterium]